MTGPEADSLLDRILDGTADAEALARFHALLEQDSAVRLAYVDQMRMHALLQWRHGLIQAPVSRPGRLTTWRRWAVAALVLLALGLGGWLVQRSSQPLAFAQVIVTQDVVWDAAQRPLDVGSALGTEALRLQGGMLKIQIDSGAMVTVQGPADFELVAPLRLRVRQGKVMVRMEPPLTGFQVETPTTAVTDLGTEFGTEVSPSGRTDVIVFEGKVDVARRQDNSIQRLSRGEALRVESDGKLERIVAIERRPTAVSWSPLPATDANLPIASVSDNFRELESLHYYQIVPHGLVEGALAHVDRTHHWTGIGADGIPRAIAGAGLVMTFNDDKRKEDLAITVTLRKPAMLYVLFDDRVPAPAWLRERFSLRSEKIGLAEREGPGAGTTRAFSIWECRAEQPGPVVLGPMAIRNPGGKAMYGIAATPLP